MNRQYGVTLVELLLTIVVLTALLAIGVPTFKQFVKNNRLTAQANDLVIAIQLARSEAVKRTTSTFICASDDGSTCSGNDNWTTGWIVFSDLNRNGIPDVGATPPLCEASEDCMIRTASALEKSTLDGNGASDIRFLPDGLTNSGAAITLTLEAYDCSNNQVRDITVTRQGHTLVSNQPCP